MTSTHVDGPGTADGPNSNDIGIIAFSQAPNQRRHDLHDEIELVQMVVRGVIDELNIDTDRIDFTVSGSSDLLVGRPFSFVGALDGIKAWPPICESHVEMDGAWALYEAWVRLLHGDIDLALAYSFGRSSQGDVPDVLVSQLDPYYVAPLWPDSISLAALQARALLDSGRFNERDFAEVAVRSRRSALDNPMAQLSGEFDVEAILTERPLVAPLRKHDCPPITDGAAAVILARGDVARSLCERPAWIRGVDHRIEAHGLGVRDLTRSASTTLAAERAGVHRGPIDVAELHAPFSHQELILKDALSLGDDVEINPSGGALASNPIMVAGLQRFGEAARRIMNGQADRALAHATSGPLLQQNMVCVLEGE